MRKLFISLFLFVLFVTSISAFATPIAAQPGAQAAANKTAKGTITAITEQSFDLEMTEGGAKHTMQFAVEPGIEVHGKVGVGANATIEYKTSEKKNVALKVTVEG